MMMSNILISEERIFIVDTDKDVSPYYDNFCEFCESLDIEIDVQKDGDDNPVYASIWPNKSYACDIYGNTMSLADPNYNEDEFEFLAPMSLGINLLNELSNDNINYLKSKIKEFCDYNQIKIEKYRIVRYKKYAEEEYI